jgi:hypothetical protein
MHRGDFHHIRLTVSDLSQSVAFFLMAALDCRVAHRTPEIIRANAKIHFRNGGCAEGLWQDAEAGQSP